jgi:hypothetical protein
MTTVLAPQLECDVPDFVQDAQADESHEKRKEEMAIRAAKIAELQQLIPVMARLVMERAPWHGARYQRRGRTALREDRLVILSEELLEQHQKHDSVLHASLMQGERRVEVREIPIEDGTEVQRRIELHRGPQDMEVDEIQMLGQLATELGGILQDEPPKGALTGTLDETRARIAAWKEQENGALQAAMRMMEEQGKMERHD